MLLYEFAVIPDVFDCSVLKDAQSLESVSVVHFLRGLSENGLLANLYKDEWYKDVERWICQLPQELRSQIKVCLNRLSDRHRLVRHPKRGKKPSHVSDWLKLGMISHETNPFHGIVLEKELMESCTLTDDALIELSQVLNSSRWHDRRRSLTLRKCKDDYRKCLTPILRYARALTLVDPYFNTKDSRFFDTIKLCSNLMGRRPGLDRLQGRIHIHVDKKKQRLEEDEGSGSRPYKEYLDSWEDKLRTLNCKDGHQFKVFLWNLHQRHSMIVSF